MKQNDTPSATQWHRLLGTLLEYFLTPVGIEVSTNVEVMSTPPEADILLLRRYDTHWTEEQKARLPDGIRDSDASHILIEFKYTQSFNELALRQAIGYDYFYQMSRKLDRQELQTVIVSARTPHQAVLSRLGYEPAGHPGVFYSQSTLLENILLLVANGLEDTSYNAPITCFASRKPIKRRALSQLFGTRWKNTSSLFWWFLDGLFTYWFERQGENKMAQEIAVTPEMITQMGKKTIDLMLSTLPAEEILKRLPRQDVIRYLSPEERLQDLDIAEIERYLQKVKTQQLNQTTSQEASKEKDNLGSKHKSA